MLVYGFNQKLPKELVYLYLYHFAFLFIWIIGCMFGGNSMDSFKDTIPLVKMLYMPLIAHCFLVQFKVGLLDKDSVRVLFKILVILGTLVGMVEIWSTENGYLKSLYKSDRYILVGKLTTFFNVTYYSALFYFTLFIYLYHENKTNKNHTMIYAVLAGLIVLLSQSKALVILLAIYLTYLAVSARNIFSKISLILILLGSVYLVIQSDFLRLYFTYFYVFIEGILKGDIVIGEVGSFSIRLEQIKNAYLDSSLLYGAGVKVYPLESWVAVNIYRFGPIFGNLFMLGYILYGFHVRISSDPASSVLKVFLILSPIIMFSSPMIEFPKITILYSLILGSYFYHAKRNETSYS